MIKDMKEEIGRNTAQISEVMETIEFICSEDKFPDVADVAHRLGRANPQNKGRGIIFKFTSRFYRDAVWRAAKDADFLTENRLKIMEDLSPADRARRSKLWPAVEKARKENKRDFFAGGRAFVDEQRDLNKLEEPEHSVCPPHLLQHP
ncbi:hypothetical protein ROHU_018071 [Labeo rohita]|uniref:Uncharacterized protein n=1 Tax=Labeo rohita TaxID=84645 RepID=A0A498NFE7_LABRO|nr:hypothetical protein ROHU_018071 [Labeo rohita]